MLEDVTTEGLSPDIHVAGDIISKKYDFMMGDIENNPYKIAQVVKKFKMIAEPKSITRTLTWRVTSASTS